MRGRTIYVLFMAFMLISLASATAYGFTQEQVTDGENQYAELCAKCHGSTGQGGAGPALKGSGFLPKWEDAAQLRTYIRAEKAKYAEGGEMRGRVANALVAYLGSLNGIKPGDTALSGENVYELKLVPGSVAFGPAPPPAPPAPPPTAAPAPAPTTLPQTASPLPVTVALGLGLVATGTILIHHYSRRRG